MRDAVTFRPKRMLAAPWPSEQIGVGSEVPHDGPSSTKMPYHPDCVDAVVARDIKWEKLEREAEARATGTE